MKLFNILSFLFISSFLCASIHGLETFDPDHPELLYEAADEPADNTPQLRIAVIGYYFRSDYSLPADTDVPYMLALQSKQSWSLFAADHGYEFLWRDQSRHIPPAMRRTATHPRWYKYHFIQEALTPLAEGGLGFDAVLCFAPDTFWTGSSRHLPLEVLLRSYPASAVFLGHAFTFKTPKDKDEEAARGSPAHFKVNPEHAGFAVEPALLLVRGGPRVVKTLGEVYEDSLDVPSSEAAVVRETFPPALVTSEKHITGSLKVMRSFPLGTTFIAPSMLWEPSHFALSLMTEDKKPANIKDSLRTATKLVNLHAKSRDLTQFDLSKVPIFPTRQQVQLVSE